MANTTTAPTTEREHYLASFEREYEVTLRVLKAYPPKQAQMRWTERSHTAMEIAYTLFISQLIIGPVLTEPELKPGGDFPPAPKEWEAIVGMFEQAHRDATKKLTSLTEDVFKSTIIVPVGPGATAPVRRADALWMMLFDTVHHRGQFSVYLRAAGGKVPSIYGPSGDEPWA